SPPATTVPELGRLCRNTIARGARRGPTGGGGDDRPRATDRVGGALAGRGRRVPEVGAGVGTAARSGVRAYRAGGSGRRPGGTAETAAGHPGADRPGENGQRPGRQPGGPG